MNDLWSERLRVAKAAYQLAKAAHAAAISEHHVLPKPDGHHAWMRTALAETAALREYERVLRIHGNVVIRGEFPPE